MLRGGWQGDKCDGCVHTKSQQHRHPDSLLHSARNTAGRRTPLPGACSPWLCILTDAWAHSPAGVVACWPRSGGESERRRDGTGEVRFQFRLSLEVCLQILVTCADLRHGRSQSCMSFRASRLARLQHQLLLLLLAFNPIPKRGANIAALQHPPMRGCPRIWGPTAPTSPQIALISTPAQPISLVALTCRKDPAAGTLTLHRFSPDPPAATLCQPWRSTRSTASSLPACSSFASSAVSDNAMRVFLPCDAAVLAVLVLLFQTEPFPDLCLHPFFQCFRSLVIGHFR